jgi:hypothetical protein
MPESFVENLVLHNVSIRVTRAFDYSHRAKHAGGPSNPRDDRITRYARQPSYCTLANVRNLVVDNLRVDAVPGVREANPRSALSLFHAEGAVLRTIARSPATPGAVLELHQVQDALVTGCVATPGRETFLRTYGMAEGDVTIEANRLRNVRQVLDRRDE